jgi:putative transposase
MQTPPLHRTGRVRVLVNVSRRAYKYRLLPTARQEAALRDLLETHRRIYNFTLEVMKDIYEREGRTATPSELYGLAALVRNRHKGNWEAHNGGPCWWYFVPAAAMRDTVYRAVQSRENFFRRVREGAEKPGYPKFKGYYQYESIPYISYEFGGRDKCGLLWKRDGIERFVGRDPMTAEWPPTGYFLRMGGGGRTANAGAVGDIRVKLHRPVGGIIDSVVVRLVAGRWYVCLSCRVPSGKQPLRPLTGREAAIGIDLGITHFLTTDANYPRGDHVANPRYLVEDLPALRRLDRRLALPGEGQRRLRRCYSQKGSNRRAALVLLRKKLFEHLANRRKEHHYEVALKLVRTYSIICVEDLDVANMVAGKLARDILDVAWGQFLTILEHKAEEAGVRMVRVPPAYTSQTCSQCGFCDKGNRKSQSEFCCLQCDFACNADVNAARNIRTKGLQILVETSARKAANNGEP